MNKTIDALEEVIYGYCVAIKESEFSSSQSCVVAADIILKLASAAAELRRAE